MTKTIYLLGWEVTLDGSQECQNFIATMRTNKETAEVASSGIELVFENDILTQAFSYSDGERSLRQLRDNEKAFPYVPGEEHRLYNFTANVNGPHQLGGEIPWGFHLPKIKLAVSFQYLGFISKDDELFNWLPFHLNLACPIYLNFEKVFLDYSDPGWPEVINKEELEGADTSHEEDVNSETEIVYSAKKFRFKETVESTLSCAGIPTYLQYPAIPTCPKSGKLMKFVCQLDTGVP
ncbi:MAG TPA: hypothetical protein VFE50_08225, partial [Cyclobacteriaceae bacterium]|nr:hypothetical protein [Cyclobacteriaceae bacterium]